jgi:hypothetical protein
MLRAFSLQNKLNDDRSLHGGALRIKRFMGKTTVDKMPNRRILEVARYVEIPITVTD